MKIGDKLYCKKTLEDIYTVYFIKNKTYHIYHICDYNAYIDSDCKIEIRFDLRKINNDSYKLYDYFYTEQEYRKAKLNNLEKLSKHEI